MKNLADQKSTLAKANKLYFQNTVNLELKKEIPEE